MFNRFRILSFRNLNEKKMNIRSKIVTVCAFLLLTLAGHCDAGSDSVDLSRIVVTPSRFDEPSGQSPSKVDVITSRDILTSTSYDISEQLDSISGVTISDYGGPGSAKTVRMRGSTAAQVLVMVDGRPMNSPRDGETDLSTVPLNSIDRVEVVHGPGNSLYGSSGMGGAINIITRKPPDSGQRTELYSSFGTYRTYTERASHGAKIGSFGYLLNSGYQYSQGIRQNSKFDARDINAKLEYDLNSENTVSLYSSGYKSKVGAPGTLSSPDLDDRQDNSKSSADLSWTFKPKEMFAIENKIYGINDRLEFAENSAGSFWDIAGKKDVHNTKARGFNTQISGDLTDNIRGAFGFNYLANKNESTSSGKHRYTVRAAYIENSWAVNKALRLNLGARVDDYSNFGTETCPSGGLRWTLNDNLGFRASMAKSFRAPTFNDLYWPDDGWTKGNPSLKPEKGVTKEAGIDLKMFDRLSSSAALFRSDYSDLINWTEESFVWSPKNVSKARIDGIEIDNSFKINDSFEALLDYAFLKPRDKFSHKYLVYHPRNKFNAGLKYSDISGFSCGLECVYTGRRYQDSDNTVKVKHFYIYNLNLAKKINSNFSCFASFKNLLNRKYQVMRDYPAPGFSLTGGVKASF